MSRVGYVLIMLHPHHHKVSLARSPPLKDEEGKCVGLLLTSYDRTLVVKEISSEEVEEMHNILSEYHQVGFFHFLLYDRRWGNSWRREIF